MLEVRRAKHFGDDEAQLRFKLLPVATGKTNCRLENLFDKSDLALMGTECGIPSNAKFNKVILTTYYSDRRDEILDKVSATTKKAFADVVNTLW